MSRGLTTLTLTGILCLAGATFAADTSRSAQTRHKLDTPLPASVVVDFSKGVSLKDALDFLRDVSDVNFHVNWKVIKAAGIDPEESQVSFRLRNVTPRKVLKMILNEAGNDQLAFYIDEGIIEVTTNEKADELTLTMVYPIDDLLVTNPQMMGGGMGMGMMGGMMGGMGGGMGGGGYGGGGGGGSRRSGGGSSGGYGGSGGGYGGGGYGGGYGGYGGGGGGYGMGGMGGMMGGMGGMGGYGGGMMGGMGMGGMGMGGYGGLGGMGGYGGMGGGYGGTGGGTNGSGSNGAPGTPDEIMNVIKGTIFPKYWTDNKDSMKAYQGNLIITAPRKIHEAIGGPIE